MTGGDRCLTSRGGTEGLMASTWDPPLWLPAAADRCELWCLFFSAVARPLIKELPFPSTAPFITPPCCGLALASAFTFVVSLFIWTVVFLWSVCCWLTLFATSFPRCSTAQVLPPGPTSSLLVPLESGLFSATWSADVTWWWVLLRTWTLLWLSICCAPFADTASLLTGPLSLVLAWTTVTTSLTWNSTFLQVCWITWVLDWTVFTTPVENGEWEFELVCFLCV